jgi:hypothetical protein
VAVLEEPGAAAELVELTALVVGTVVLLEVLGMMVAEVSRRTWAWTVEVVGAGVDVLTGVLVLVLDGQALGIAEPSHSSSCLARRAQASSSLMDSGDPDLLGSRTTKS